MCVCVECLTALTFCSYYLKWRACNDSINVEEIMCIYMYCSYCSSDGGGGGGEEERNASRIEILQVRS